MNSKSYFLVAAFASFVLSVSLWFFGNADIAKEQGIFVGLGFLVFLHLVLIFVLPVIRDNHE